MIALAVLVAPFVLAWGVYIASRWQAAASLTRTLGAGADPARVAREAEKLALLQMNQWSVQISGYVVLLWLGVLVPATWIAFTVPPRRRETIRTRRLTLRRARGGDLEDLHAIHRDAETMRYWDSAPHGSIADTQVWLKELLALSPDHSDLFVIEHQGHVIGTVGIWRWPWLSFVLARSEWHKGYGAEAMTAFLQYIFGRGLELVTAATDQRNLASQALLRKCDFREYQRGEGRHAAKDEAYAFVAMRRDHPALATRLRRLRSGSRGVAEAAYAAPLWA